MKIASIEAKMTSIEMEWTDTGSIVKSTMPVNCPRCGVACTPNVEHRCGDKAAPVKAKKKKAVAK